MEGNTNSNPLEPKDLPPRLLFPNFGSSSRSRSLSQSASIMPVVSSLSQPQWETPQKPSATATEVSSALAEAGRQFKWSPLKSPQGFGSPVRGSGTPIQGSSTSPARSADRIGAIRAAASVTPISPKITAPPDIHKSHKKEKAAARSPFGFQIHKSVKEDDEDDDNDSILGG